MRILILGGTGLLGSFLKRYFLKKKKKVFSTGYKKKSKYYLNLFNQNNILKFFNLIKPNIIINCAAQTNVEKCINDFYFGYKGNALIVKNVVSAIKKLKYKPHFIHFSTDQVYNNTKKRKSSEYQVSLTNNYSITKYLGELEAKKILLSDSNDYINELSRLMNESWMQKKKLSIYVSNKKIDSIYDYALINGA